MTSKNRHISILTALLLSIALAGLTGCSTKQPEPATPATWNMSESAQVNYHFLVYQDQVQRLQKHANLGKDSKLTAAEVAEIRQNAVDSLNALLELAPSPGLYLELAGVHWNDKNGAARARQILRQGLEKFPDDRTLTIYLANSYAMDNRTQDAMDIMDDYLSRHPDDYLARQRLAQMYMDAEEDAKALDQFKRIPVTERSADALYGMGRVQGNLGMRKAAITNLQKALKMDPGFTEAMVELAYQYELAKNYVAAENTYTTILEQGHPFPEARLRIINLNLKLNNPARALEMALDGPPTKSFILDAVLMFINDDFYAQGSTVLDMLTSNGEIPSEYYFYKAVIANEGENDIPKAMDYLAKVKEDDRLYPHALDFKARMLQAQGKTDEALELARQAKTRLPQAAIFYRLESKLLLSQGHKEEAEAVLKEGIAKLVNNPELTYDLGMLYEDTGRRPEGLALMEELLRANPDHTNALNYVGYTLAEEGRDLDRALVLVKKASEMDPENGFILDSVAWVYFKQKDYAKAWLYIGYAVDVVDDDPTIWEHYGDIALARGDKKEARKAYNYALKFGSRNAKQVKKKLQSL